MKQVIAWLVLFTGLVFSALGVARMGESKEIAGLFKEKWFLGGLAAILAAIVVNRVGTLFVHKDTESAGGDTLSSLKEKLVSVLSILKQLKDERSAISLKELAGKIDHLQSNEIFDVVEGRNAIIAQAGYGAYGSFMSDFATGERFISRSWSAAVDGYEEEAFDYVEKAAAFFQKAHEQFEQVLARSMEQQNL